MNHGAPLLITVVNLSTVMAYWALVAYVLFYVARTPRPFRVVVFFLVAFSAGLTDVFYLVAGKTLEYADFVDLWVSINGFDTGIQAYWATSLYAVIRLLILYVGLFHYRNVTDKGSPFAAAALCVCCCLAVTTTCYLKQGQGTNKLASAFSVYGLAVAHVFDSSRHGMTHTHRVGWSATDPSVDNIVVIVDESVRADFFDRNVQRQVFDIPERRPWRIYNFGYAVSGSNCSVFANAVLRKGPRIAAITRDLRTKPYIWEFAKNAGYRTVLVDLNRGGLFSVDERRFVDVVDDMSGTRRDVDIIPALDKYTSVGRNFIYVMKRGSHFSYKANYPSDYGPQFTDRYINQTAVRQEYSRSIKYQTERMFQAFADRQWPSNMTVLYTSDHGQNLDDVGGLTHCTTGGPPYDGEGLVPLVVLSNTSNEGLAAGAAQNRDVASHFNVLPTVLRWFGYTARDVSTEYEPALSDRMTRRYGFSVGTPFGYFGRPAIVAETDIDMFRKKMTACGGLAPDTSTGCGTRLNGGTP